MSDKMLIIDIPEMAYEPNPSEFIAERITGYSQDFGDEELRLRFPFLPINPPVSSVNSVQVTTSVPTKSLPVPSGARLVRFSANQQFFVSRLGATIPTADILDGTAPLQNPRGWYDCTGIQSFSIYCATNNAIITAEFYVQK